MQRMQEAQPDAIFKEGAEPLVVKVSGGEWEDAVINLHRIHGFCEDASPADCERVKAEFVERTLTKPEKVTAKSLRIAVRDQEYVDYIGELEVQAKEGGSQAVRRPLGGGLYAILVSDAPTTVSLVGAKGLSELGMDEQAAWAQAWQQTRAILPALPDPQSFREKSAAFEGEEYLASLLADLDAWQKISDAAGPDFFVTAVSDQFVFAGIMPDGARLADFRKAVEEDCRASPRCVSPDIYRFRDGRWVIAP